MFLKKKKYEYIDYEAWDVLAHELGHAVDDANGVLGTHSKYQDELRALSKENAVQVLRGKKPRTSYDFGY